MVVLGDSSLGVLSTLGRSAVATTPYAAMLVEAALTNQLRLALGATGNYQKREDDDRDRESTTNGVTPYKATSFGVGIGPRWIFNPGQLVEISTLVVFGFARSDYERETRTIVPATTSETSSLRITKDEDADLIMDARLGVVLEYELLPRLHLRMDNQLVRGSYGWYRTRVSGRVGPDDRMTGTQVALHLGWAPFLMLRLSI